MKFKDGDIIVALESASEEYGMTKGEKFEGKVLRIEEEELIGDKRKMIEVEILKGEKQIYVGEICLVNSRHFKLKYNDLEELEDF